MEPLGAAASAFALLAITGKVIKGIKTVYGATQDRKRLREELRAIESILHQLTDEVDDAEEGDGWRQTLAALEAPEGPVGRLHVVLTELLSKLQIDTGAKKIASSLKWPFKEDQVKEALVVIEREKSLLLLALTNNSRKLLQEIKATAKTNQKTLDGLLLAFAQESALNTARLDDIQDHLGSIRLNQEKSEQNSKHGEILRWLSPLDHSVQQNDFIFRRQPGTGKWLLESHEYEALLKGINHTLFCPGIPGAGKTILTSVIIEDLFNRSRDEPDSVVAFLYFNFNRNAEQSIEDILGSIARQLLQQVKSVPSSLADFYEKSEHNGSRRKPNLQEICSVLETAVQLCPRVFVVVDALDECQRQTRSQFLARIFELQANHHVSVFMTSRPITEITGHFEKKSTVEIKAHESDLRLYLESRMFSLPACVLRSPNLQRNIIEAIIDSTDGMFLLAQLHMQSLEGGRSQRAIMTALEQLPRGTDPYDAAYNDAMLRIQGQNPDRAKLAKQALAWISRSPRELQEQDLQVALAIKPGDRNLDIYDIPDIEDILESCAGLVTVVEETDIIRLVHYTMQEYFDRTWTRWFPDAENELGVACVTYLLFGEVRATVWYADPDDRRITDAWNGSVLIDSVDSSSDDEHDDACSIDSKSHDSFSVQSFSSNHEPTVIWDERIKRFARVLDANPFYSHAAVHWAHHARNIEEPWPELEEFLSCREAFLGVFYFLYESGNAGVDGPGSFPFRPYKALGRVTSTHLLAYVGLVDILRKTHDHTYGLDTQDNRYMTPLMHAAQRGHLPFVAYLLDHGADHALQNDQGCTALALACSARHLDVVEALLQMDTVDVNLRNKYGDTPFIHAVDAGYLDIVERLLATGKVDVDAANSCHGLTPLGLAIENRRVDMCRVLLDKGGANINLTGRLRSFRLPLLIHAVMSNSLPILKLLLGRKGIQVNLKNKKGETALHLAAKRGSEEMTRLLLNLGGADGTERDQNGRTPLMASVSNANPAVLELLLSAEGTELDARDLFGRTAFSLAAGHSSHYLTHLRLMNRLESTKKVDVNSQDNDGRTPLHHAILAGNTLVFKELLQYDDINPNIPDRRGFTPLKTLTREVIAAAGAHSIHEVEPWMLHRGLCRPLLQELRELAAILAMGFETSTPTPFSINPDKISMISSESLAKIGGDMRSFDDFSIAHREITQLGDKCMGLADMAERLLEVASIDFDRRNTGPDDQPFSGSQRTECPALVVVCDLGADTDLVDVLLSIGAAINAVDDRGISPLSSAVAHSPVEVVGHLLARGAHPESRDRLGRTALGHVTGKTDPAIIKLLLQHGADVHTKDLQGKTPLMKVVTGEDSKEAVAILLEAGARVDDRDEEGHDVIWHAREGLTLDERRHLIEMLETSLGRPAGEEGWEEGKPSA